MKTSLKRLRVIVAVAACITYTAAHATRIKEALEQYDLQSLNYVGTARDSCGQVVAHIIDPAGYGHSPTAGNYIGRNFGQIQKITEEALIILEIHKVKAGGDEWEERVVTLKRRNQ